MPLDAFSLADTRSGVVMGDYWIIWKMCVSICREGWDGKAIFSIEEKNKKMMKNMG